MPFAYAYIQDAGPLNSFKAADTPPLSEIQAAVSVLAYSPVSIYPSFSVEEVELVGKYRELLAPRRLTHRTDDFGTRLLVVSGTLGWSLSMKLPR